MTVLVLKENMPDGFRDGQRATGLLQQEIQTLRVGIVRHCRVLFNPCRSIGSPAQKRKQSVI